MFSVPVPPMAALGQRQVTPFGAKVKSGLEFAE